jgi:ADP-ribose pyrophosphatase
VDVLLDLEEAVTFLGLDASEFESFGAGPCTIEPPEARDQLDPSALRIVELVCMHWSRTNLRPLAGGFSGSLLFIADGWKGDARTEPMVLKIDAFTQMRRELDGYHQVKDFFGKNVPTFGYPVTHGDYLGVGMELAAMEGRPATLQDTFEEAEDEGALTLFFTRLEKALDLLGDRLYRNTRETSWVAPFRAFGLHVERQLAWLKDNAEIIVGYVDEAGGVPERVDVEQLVSVASLIVRNEDGLENETCLQHGDLNFANVICDEGDNIWFIDWTHSGPAPLELDFAKLESDAKFVMSKAFEHDDLGRLKRFEDFLLAHPVPPDVDGLPDSLKFVKWDLRYRKILGTVRRVRQACFALKEADDWLTYRVALLRYATHTLSFDERRGRGECTPTMLMYALYSAEALAMDLVADDFHLKIRAERPPEYPPRQRISIDESIWILDCEEYDPPYFVSPEVLAADNTATPGGWADPEDASALGENLKTRESRFRDDEDRPLNPRGRTGIAGRGLLGLWGANLSVAPLIFRNSSVNGRLEVLLGTVEDDGPPELPKGFLLPGEDAAAGLSRVLQAETGWSPATAGEVVAEGYTYDPRQTDHAWVETRGVLILLGEEEAPDLFEPGGDFVDAGWWPLDAGTANRLPSGHAGLLREAVGRLRDSEHMDTEVAERFLAATG